MSRNRSADVAVVGAAARLPNCNGIEDWWLALRAGQVLTHRFTRSELRKAGVSPAELEDPDYVPVYGRLDGVLSFDRGLFGISPREAAFLDPQHRMMLEVAWSALEDAGLPPRGDEGRVGVVASSTGSTYLRAVLRQGDVDPGTMDDLIHGSEPDFAATRISHKLGLRGLAISVQTACSSSLVGVHLAVQSLLNGDCDKVVVVASGLTFPQVGYRYQSGGVLSATGHCRPFDHRADGVVPGAGVVAVVLQLAETVHRDAPTPYGRVLATAVNNDGATKAGYYAPSVQGQREVISTAWQVAGVDASTAGYLETHGTGTALGDPIEWFAASQAFRQLGASQDQIPVGAVKANVGHLDAASGLVGLVKTLLVLRDELVPPMAGFGVMNPLLPLEGSPLRVPSQLEPLASGACAGVSSFGIGGTNAHVVVGAWAGAPKPTRGSDETGREQRLVLSAADAPTLRHAAQALADWLERDTDDLSATADALARGRTHLSRRAVTRGASRDELRDALRRLDTSGSVDSQRPPEVALLFPGQGTHYPGMARVLAEELPGFEEQVRSVTHLLPQRLGAEALQAMWDEDFPPDALRETRLAQPVLFCTQFAAAMALREMGLEPVAAVGHSLGEITAAAFSRGLPLEQAVDLVVARGAAMHACPPGRMLSVVLPESDVLAMIDQAPLDLAAVNGATHCVIAGAGEDVERFAASLPDGLRSQLLDTDRAFHSRLIQPSLERIAAVDLGEVLPSTVPVISTVTGQPMERGHMWSIDHFVRGAEQPVRFADALGALADLHPGCTVLEVGSGRSLSALVELAGMRALSLQRTRTRGGVLVTLDGLWVSGVIDLVEPPQTDARTRPPGYAFGFGQEYSLLSGARRSSLPDTAEEPQTAGPVEGRPVDVVVRAAWQESLGAPVEDGAANYFELGGDSLSMVRLLRRLETDLGARVPLAELLARPTMSAHIEVAAQSVRQGSVAHREA